jgi:hypothetical protein
VVGLKEALEALATKYPQVKTKAVFVPDNTKPGGNPAQKDITELGQLQAQLDEARKNKRNAEVIALTNKIFKLQNK